jgi:dTDP-glucose 4,6-dehydratase
MIDLNKFTKRVMITGGFGFIGSHVVRRFVLNHPDYLVLNFDKLTYAGNPSNLQDVYEKPNYIIYMGDVCDHNAVNEAMTQFKITDILHFAAESHVDRSMVNPTNFVDTNIVGTVTLLEAAKNHWTDGGLHRFINMGTDEIFGSLDIDDKPFDENTPFDPHSPYSASKTAAVIMAKSYYDAFNLPVINIACGNAIGPNQFPEKLVPLVIDRLVNMEPIPVYGEGHQMRDWTNVHDIARAMDIILEHGRPGEMYCLGGDACRSNIDIINTLIEMYATVVTNDGNNTPERLEAKIAELKGLITFIPDPRGRAHDFRYDINHKKATDELRWEPQYTFEDSVWQTLNWYLNNQHWVKNVKDSSYKKWIDDYYGRLGN